MSAQPVRQIRNEVYEGLQFGIGLTPEDFAILFCASRVCVTAWSYSLWESRRSDDEAILMLDLTIESNWHNHIQPGEVFSNRA